MNLYYSPKYPKLAGCLTLWSALHFAVIPAAQAAPATPASPAGTTPTTNTPTEKAPATADAHDFLSVANTQRAFKMPLDLAVENASIKDVVTRVEKVLATRKETPAPPIEVRGVRPVRLTFTVKDSTVGGVLSAAARLAGARLYFFAGYVLLAPADALLPDEIALTSQGLGDQWGKSNANFFGDKGAMAKRQVLASFIAKDMGGLPAGWSSQPPLTAQTKPIPVGQLSPDAQAMLKELVDNLNAHIPQDNPITGTANAFSFSLSSDTEVNLSGANSGTLMLSSPNKGQMTWELSGHGFGWGGGSRGSTSKPSLSPAAPPVDPSAGKS